MERFVELPAQRAAVDSCERRRQHIGMPLAPGGIGDFCDDAIQRRAILRVAVIEAHRVEYVSAVTQVREQADGARGWIKPGGRDALPDCVGK